MAKEVKDDGVRSEAVRSKETKGQEDHEENHGKEEVSRDRIFLLSTLRIAPELSGRADFEK